LRSNDWDLALRSEGQLARAGEVLKRALAVDGGDAATWHQLGLVHLGQGRDIGRSRRFPGRLSSWIPDLPEAHNSLGGLWLESRDFSRAEPGVSRGPFVFSRIMRKAHTQPRQRARFDQSLPGSAISLRDRHSSEARLRRGTIQLRGLRSARMNRIGEARPADRSSAEIQSELQRGAGSASDPATIRALASGQKTPLPDIPTLDICGTPPRQPSHRILISSRPPIISVETSGMGVLPLEGEMKDTKRILIAFPALFICMHCRPGPRVPHKFNGVVKDQSGAVSGPAWKSMQRKQLPAPSERSSVMKRVLTL